MSGVRNFGVEAVTDVARRTVAHPHPYVTGFNMAGQEAGHPATDYAEAFAIVRRRRPRALLPPGGSGGGPESIRAALELGVTRLSHGVRAIEDPGLVAELAQRGTVLEVCPTSNVVLGVYEDFAGHPFPALREAGVKLTLGSDDPPYFGAIPGRRVPGRRRRFGLSDPELTDLTRTAIEAAFVQEESGHACSNGCRSPL
jgi:adenosine deaminase